MPARANALSASASATVRVQLAQDPDLSPDGSQLAFSWRGDLWTVASTGGRARRLTHHEGHDRSPKFAPDGRSLAFTSDRDGSVQVYLLPIEGGQPRQITHHTAGFQLEAWYPDGESLLVSGQRDHFWKRAERFFKISVGKRQAEQLLFDDYGAEGRLSADGHQLLFTREGPAWWRQGYQGSQAAQIWRFDSKSNSFAQILHPPTGARWPLWKPASDGFYYVGASAQAQNLYHFDFTTRQSTQLTNFAQDSIVFPCLARNGSVLVFRHLFDFYRWVPTSNEPPQRLTIEVADDQTTTAVERRTLTTSSHVSYSRDGLEIAFIAGGDVWVMDTELREPRQVTSTPEEERDVQFSPDGKSLVFVSDQEGQTDLWSAQRVQSDRFWWLNDEFHLTRITNNAAVEADPKWNVDGSRLAFVQGLGELVHSAPDGSDLKTITRSFNSPDYNWSPDGRWLAYAQSDDDFNRDVWIVPIDGSIPPLNVSRHPDNDGGPVWSPDGRVLAFTGRRANEEVDIFYVWLRAADEELSRRDRTLRKALEKMQKGRPRKTSTKASGNPTANSPTAAAASPANSPASTAANTAANAVGVTPEANAGESSPDSVRRTVPEMVIDLEGIHERVHRLPIADSTESQLFWSQDGKKLAFSGTVEGKRGTYFVEFPEDLKPKSLVAQVGSHARWLESGQIVWLSLGTPATISATGTATAYRFQSRQEYSRSARDAAVFDQCWRVMRDQYYDERLNNRDWNEVRQKYREMAAQAGDSETLTRVIQLMLGELNGSHLGFTLRGEEATAGAEPPASPNPAVPTDPPPATDPATAMTRSSKWQVTTAHLGLRFVAEHGGPGLLVRDVIPESPADQLKTKIKPGETILAIQGQAVDPASDLTSVLNGPPDRELVLKVKSAAGAERQVTLRPITYADARRLLYDAWVKANRRRVEQLSAGRLGYLHISGMNMPSFYRFEEELYAVGAGKEGLVIDVRENPGGSITDHLLTVLTQPTHAVTVPRGGGPGYPQDRIVYATWRKPIVVLCNQNSFSNAEVFSHAIKTLGRGKLVGTPTAGGVISTGSATIMDVGTLRLPFRGWHLRDTGEDMELQGAQPDVVVWPQPGELPRGQDSQLEKAIEVLTADVDAAKQTPRPKLIKASERQPASGATPQLPPSATPPRGAYQ
jgi:tricorn protease